MKNNLKQYVLSAALAIAVSACGSISNVSKDGTTKDPIWPKVEDAAINYNGLQHGIWPNWNNVHQIESGMTKEQLYYLIGRPHFKEGIFNVHEWDYVFNYRQNGQHKICQFKVLFDSNMSAKSFFWKPKGCNNQYELTGDFLFDFDSSTLSAKGKSEIDKIINVFKKQGIKSITVDGYTDHLGSEAYNLKLSQERANIVKTYIVSRGFPESAVTAKGMGESSLLNDTCNNQKGEALRSCLRAERRVVISGQ